MTWTLTYGGSTKSFADWKIENPVFEFVSLAPDVFSFDAIEDAASPAQFNYGATVGVQRDGVQFFVGKVISTPQRGSSASERRHYQIAGPWWDLDRLLYQQSSATWDSGSSQHVKTYSTHYNLGILVNWNANPWVTIKADTSMAIDDILDWVILCDSSILQIGTIFTGLNMPVQEDKDKTCGECIKKVLRWHPDVVSWFDYSTTPPTINLSKQGDLVALNISTNIANLEITPRNDLVLPGVCLKYERTDLVNGSPVLLQVTDSYPSPGVDRIPGALVMTIDLRGGSTTTVTGQIASAAIANNLIWWRSKLPWLNETKILNAVISNAVGAVVDNSDDPGGLVTGAYELIAGSWASWMPVKVADFLFEADLMIEYIDEQNNSQIRTERVSANVKCTSAPPGVHTYSTVTSFESAEDVPVGLAEGVFNARKDLQYSGSAIVKSSECGGLSSIKGPGLRLNFSSLSGFESINAMVQRCTMTLESGETTYEFGPPEHLGPQDLIELTNMNRNRINWSAPESFATGTAGGNQNQVNLPKHTNKENSNTGLQLNQKMSIVKGLAALLFDATGTLDGGSGTANNPKLQIAFKKDENETQNTAAVTIEASDLKWVSPSGVKWISVKLRKYKYCKAGVEYFVWLLGSELWSQDGTSHEEPVT